MASVSGRGMRTSLHRRAPGKRPAARANTHRQIVSEPSLNNVLTNFGSTTIGELSTRISLAVKVNELLDQQDLSQNAAAERLAMPQSKISAIRNYKLHGISLERLMRALIGLNQQVEIVVKPAGASRSHSIEVVT